MVLDITIILIFLISTLRGKTKGLGDTALRLAALVLGVVAGTLLAEPFAEIIKITPLDEAISSNLRELAQGNNITLTDFVPDNLVGMLTALGTSDNSITVSHLTNLILLVLSFLIIIIAVWAIATYLRRKLKISRRQGNLAGTVDEMSGLLFGALRGAIIIMLLLACMFPLAGTFAPSKIPMLTENLNNSYIAGPLYDINPLIAFIKNLAI